MLAIQVKNITLQKSPQYRFAVDFSFNDEYEFDGFFEIEPSYRKRIYGDAGRAIEKSYDNWLNEGRKKWNQFHISSDNKEINYTEFEATDANEIYTIIGLSVSVNMLEWNVSYLQNYDPINPEISYTDNLLFLDEVHKIFIPSNDIFYNKYSKEYFNLLEDKLLKLKQKTSNKVNYLSEQYATIPLSENTYKYSLLDKLFGQPQKDNEEIYKKNIEIKKENELIIKLNTLIDEYNFKIFSNLKLIDDLIRINVDKINIYRQIFELVIKNYQDEDDCSTFYEYVIKYSSLSKYYKQDYQLVFQNNNLLLIDYVLPDEEIFSRVKDTKFNSRTLESRDLMYTDKQFNTKYESTIYSIIFKLIRELFESDFDKKIETLIINGWSNSINRQNGQRISKCILSLSISRSQYDELNFDGIELKESFKYLKGISAKSLIDKIPIPPIMQLNRNDKRFVQSIDVLQNIDDSVNLASMDWLEFEHLIRELFEKEFSPNGGEIKITQSSRDGGVDAIAFDPDPIRGGKIIIQSKRYTNVVGVSAVRDLYGTVLNEGATKGIIVTTSHFGNDAYDFANGKPLTLINGNNLLHLLEKHGYRAKIDIQEARNRL